MNFLYPQFPARQLPAMLAIAGLGLAIAGPYGALHDQISYAVSPEYFTRMKFHQFAWADLGWPPRVFASVVGFLGSWWVGLIAGWLLARAGLAEMPAAARRRRVVVAFAVILGAAVAGGAIAAALGGVMTQGDTRAWDGLRQRPGVTDVRGFVIVAFLHWGGYLGALAGLVGAVVYVRRARRAEQSPGAAPGGSRESSASSHTWAKAQQPP